MNEEEKSGGKNPSADAADLDALRRRFERERRRRLEAEQVGETTTRILYLKQQEVRLLQSIATAANESSSIAQALQTALDLVCDYLGWPIGTAYLVEAVTRSAVPARIWHLQDPGRFHDFRAITDASVFRPGEGLPGRVVESSAVAWIGELSGDTNFPRSAVAADLGILAACAFPIYTGARVAAVLEFFHTETGPPNQDVLSIMATCGAQLGRVIERVHAGEDVVRSKEVAEQASRVKSQFLANISHELRTPMNGILGMTQVLLETELTREQQEYLTIVKSSAESLLTLINDILDVSKIESTPLILESREFPLRACIEAAMAAVAAEAKKKDLRLTVHISPEVPELVRGDESRLRQVLLKLVGNAVKFTTAGEIEVTVETPPEAAGELLFTVRDTGIGIPAEMHESVFDAFTQVDGSSTRKFGGTGLGLAIAAQLVQMMGGRIWLESDGRAGSTFRFTARFAP